MKNEEKSGVQVVENQRRSGSVGLRRTLEFKKIILTTNGHEPDDREQTRMGKRL